MTALMEAFKVAGLSHADVAFDTAIARYLNSGGTIERARARLDVAAARMPAMDPANSVRNGQAESVQIRQPVEDARGHKGYIQEDPDQRASPSSSNLGGEGLVIDAHARQLAIAVPVREPTPQQRSAAASVAKVLAITVLDTLKIDGRAIGDWTVGEARAAGRIKSREGVILIEASRVVANAPSNALIREVVKPSEMQRIMQTAAEAADAV
jgi:hypothetical protein